MPAPKVSARVAHFGAPTGGWNAYDNITSMQPQDAVSMVNLVPDTTKVRLRRGSVPFGQIASSATFPVWTLMNYAKANTEHMLAACNHAIWDISGGGAGTLVPGATGFTSDMWQYVNYSTPGGQFLVAVNGTAKQWVYDGTSWTPGANTLGTGVPDSNTFACIASYQQRLFFGPSDSLLLYYLPVNVFQGELHMMDLGAFLPLGGAIAHMGTWTRDNGFGGMDDLLVIVSTMGEVIIYQGINPDDANAWNMIGRFVCGKPVGGHRGLTRLGPDMMLICEDGFQALAKYLAVGESQALTTAISRKIGNAVTQAVRQGRLLPGWESCLYARNNLMIVNIPQPAGPFVQYCVNTVTGAWTQFQGLNAYTWCIWNGQLYFGSVDGTVVSADNGPTDLGAPITFDVVTSFQLPGQQPQLKRATMCRPYMVANGICNPVMDVNVDYNITPVSSPIADTRSDTLWDEFNWDQANWASENVVQTQWYSVDGLGTAFAIHMSGTTKTLSLELLAFDLTYEAGIGVV